jgi:hypothetical protein
MLIVFISFVAIKESMGRDRRFDVQGVLQRSTPFPWQVFLMRAVLVSDQGVMFSGRYSIPLCISDDAICSVALPLPLTWRDDSSSIQHG